MALLPTKETRGVCEATGLPFYWRGWSDRERTLDGKLIQLRSSHGPPYTLWGKPVATVEEHPFQSPLGRMQPKTNGYISVPKRRGRARRGRRR